MSIARSYLRQLYPRLAGESKTDMASCYLRRQWKGRGRSAAIAARAPADRKAPVEAAKKGIMAPKAAPSPNCHLSDRSV
jgi:hypothetical protein